MTTRRITGIVHNLFDQPLVKAKIVFVLLSPTQTSLIQYPIDRQEIVTDINGEVDFELFCNAVGLEQSVYKCLMPDGSMFKFTLSPGDALTFTQLKVLGVSIYESDVSLLNYITQQISLIGSGNSGGSSLQSLILTATNNQTLFTLPVLPISPVRTMLFIEGVKYEYLQHYTLSDYVLTWIGFFNLSSSYRIQFYY